VWQLSHRESSSEVKAWHMLLLPPGSSRLPPFILKVRLSLLQPPGLVLSADFITAVAVTNLKVNGTRGGSTGPCAASRIGEPEVKI
jgi:hypothetical protein